VLCHQILSFVFVTLVPWDERDVTVKDVIKKLNPILFNKILGAQVFAFGPPALPGLGNGSGFSIMIQDKGGNTPDYLAENTTKFINEVNSRPEVSNAFTTFQANVPQRYMDVDKEKALKTWGSS